MSSTLLKIIFDRPSKAYFAGEIITGRVQLTLPSARNIRGIKIQFNGKARTSVSYMKTIYNTKLEYFDQEVYLSLEREMPAGEKKFVITYALPNDIPSTFYYKQLGTIHYFVKATLIYADTYRINKSVEETFFVVSPFNLNDNASLKEPKFFRIGKRFTIFGKDLGRLRARISLPSKGYISGQSIPIKIDVTNDSTIPVKRIHVYLRRNVIFEKFEYRIKKTKKITEMWMDGVADKSSKILEKSLEIPALQPAGGCGFMSWFYELRFELEVSGMHSNLKANFEITLGTFPIVDQIPLPISTDIALSMTPPESFLPSDVSKVSDPKLKCIDRVLSIYAIIIFLILCTGIVGFISEVLF